MKTDAFLYQLLKQLPQALFELLGQDGEKARSYRFDSVELKKSLRIDGVMLPATSELPLYFVELQFQSVAKFYANLFAKVFGYLDENDPGQDWIAVAVFASRSLEPMKLEPYAPLLESEKVHCVYLDEVPLPPDPPVALGLLLMVSVPESEVKSLVKKVVGKAKVQTGDTEFSRNVIQLVEELLMRRFTEMNLEEIRAMFELADLRDTRAWREIHAEGVEKGIEKGKALERKELVRKGLAKGMSAKQIAALMEISVKQVRRLAK